MKEKQLQKRQRRAKAKQRKITLQRIANRKRRTQRRLERFPKNVFRPVLSVCNIQYELSDRSRGIVYGGIGTMQQIAQQSGLVDAIDEKLHLLKIHLPYHESDHVLNIAYNACCGGKCLDDIEQRRNDEVFLDALGAERIPDPTTAGDFCRRFTTSEDIGQLQKAIDEARLNVWSRQPEEFFAQATIDLDGTLVGTDGECKQGIDIAYDGTWGYHPLIVSLAETGEVLRLVNRPGNRPSHEGAATQCDASIALCRQAGFVRILLRGDTDFSQTKHLDRWDGDGVLFHFGYDAAANLVEIAGELSQESWEELKRPPRYEVKTKPRERPENVKEEIIRRREYKNKRLQKEHVAEFEYRPTACSKSYRMVVVRKTISVEKGQQQLFDDVDYFFYITNDRESTASQVVFSANDRCNQENLIEQLKNGVCALRAALDNLHSNWSYMLMTSLAWTLKAWWALWLPARRGRWQSKHWEEKQRILKMDFRTFVNAMMKIPCQIVRSGRRLVYRILNWNPWQGIFFRLVHELRC